MTPDWLRRAIAEGRVTEGPRAKLPHPAPAAGEPETRFTTRVVDLARGNDWLAMHQIPLRTEKGWATGVQGDTGFPDVIAVRANADGTARVVVAELKVKTAVKPEQELWLAAFRGVPGVEVFVWRPIDWTEIEATFA